MVTPLDPTLLSRLKELAREEREHGGVENTAKYALALRDSVPQLLAHIEAQDKRVSAMVEALEAVCDEFDQVQNCCGGECSLEKARAALSAWRKNHG